MKVACIQMAVVENDKDATIAKAVDWIDRCRGSDLVLLPEIWNVGFMSFERYIREAETADGPTLAAMRAAARNIGAYLHTGSFVEEDRGRYYNSSYLLSPDGEILANYRKIHLFGYNSRETQILTPGKRIVVADTPLGKLGMATCFDLRFPELFRAMIDLGAELFLICSAWPYPRLEHWLLLNRVRAFENQAFLISANAVGMNQGVQFVGHSRIVDPWGTVSSGGGDREVILRAAIDLPEVQAARREFPGLAGRVDWLGNP